MTKRIFAILLVFTLLVSFAGCKKTTTTETVIIDDTSTSQGGESDMTSTENPSSTPSQDNDNSSTPVSSDEPVVSDPVESNPPSGDTKPDPDTTIDIDYEWKSHPEDFKLIAFTFDDGPSSNMARYVQLFSWYEGAGTFFVRGNSIKGTAQYNQMQNAINYGWSIGNHGDNHLVAAGLNGKPATYDEIKADINNLTAKLEGNLKNIDGTPYKVSFYRPPNIKPTADSFKICGEENLALIWLKYDALDWDTTKTYDARYRVFKNGIGTWKDGDVILCHEVGVVGAEDTYKILEELLPDFYRAGYRFCSISELMEMRGITLDQITGELNNVDGNRGMVTNILDAAAAGKK